MVTTTQSKTPSPEVVATPLQNETEEKGFFPMLVQSVFEPGANAAVVMAMNVSFFMLLLVLFALAFLTGWNKHVLLMLVVTGLLWGSMMWFVLEITKVQNRPDNMPPSIIPDDLDPSSSTASPPLESKKDQ